jgi:hypothetical protein
VGHLRDRGVHQRLTDFILSGCGYIDQAPGPAQGECLSGSAILFLAAKLYRGVRSFVTLTLSIEPIFRVGTG